MNSLPTVDRVFDACNEASHHFKQILLELQLHGHLHITNSGLKSTEDLLAFLPQIGFTESTAFTIGGRANAQTQDKWVHEPILRRMDFYPPSRYLLPNTEVQYLHTSPNYVLLYVDEPSAAMDGRIFLHRICEIEQRLGETALGKTMLTNVKLHGLKIITGYMDARHPDAAINYMKTWQDITGSFDLPTALQIMQQNTVSYDKVWLKDIEHGCSMVMTEITIDGFRNYRGENVLNLPRIAATPPSFENGYREFVYGNDEKFTESEIALLLEAYHATKLGSQMNKGDIYLFDNVRVAHSREEFVEPSARSIFVAMNRCVVSNRFSHGVDNDVAIISQQTGISPELFTPMPHGGTVFDFCSSNEEDKCAGLSAISRYVTPTVSDQIKESFSMVMYNLHGTEITEAIAKDINDKYFRHGILQITNQPDTAILPLNILDNLGFSVDEQFKWGGKDSGRTVRCSKGNGFHNVDKYPAHLTLLPHQEIFYQKILPINMMFHYRSVSGVGNGGRTLVHSGRMLEGLLRSYGPHGVELVEKLRKYGQTIITGFLDENHPDKDLNFVRSWQDRFDSQVIDDAIKVCTTQSTHFDDCWEEELDTQHSMLMTKVTMPLFKTDNNVNYMMFPRIPYDKPSIVNGLRRFIVGSGEEFTDGEIQLLLSAYWDSRQGMYQRPGDILMVNNIQFAHSREPYLETGKQRDAAVIMSGQFAVDQLDQ